MKGAHVPDEPRTRPDEPVLHDQNPHSQLTETKHDKEVRRVPGPVVREPGRRKDPLPVVLKPKNNDQPSRVPGTAEMDQQAREEKP
jgi:hypothetical protein